MRLSTDEDSWRRCSLTYLSRRPGPSLERIDSIDLEERLDQNKSTFGFRRIDLLRFQICEVWLRQGRLISDLRSRNRQNTVLLSLKHVASERKKGRWSLRKKSLYFLNTESSRIV